jgi:hypothetical protein
MRILAGEGADAGSVARTGKSVTRHKIPKRATSTCRSATGAPSRAVLDTLLADLESSRP